MFVKLPMRESNNELIGGSKCAGPSSKVRSRHFVPDPSDVISSSTGLRVRVMEGISSAGNADLPKISWNNVGRNSTAALGPIARAEDPTEGVAERISSSPIMTVVEPVVMARREYSGVDFVVSIGGEEAVGYQIACRREKGRVYERRGWDERVPKMWTKVRVATAPFAAPSHTTTANESFSG